MPYDLVLAIEKVQPQVIVDSLVEAELKPEPLTLDLIGVYKIERAGVFQLELDVPAGLRRAPGPRLRERGADARAAAVRRSIRIISKARRRPRLVVNLARKAMGRVALAVQLQKRPAGAEPADADG